MDGWSRFVKEMAEMDGVYKTKGDLHRFQLASDSIEERSWSMSNSEYIIEELSMRCYNRDGQAKSHHEGLCDCCVEGLEEGDWFCESDWFNGSWRQL